MVLKRAAVSGCCAAAYFYDVGSAHGQERYSSLTEFQKALMNLGHNQVNTVWVTSYQDKEIEYLKECGFKKVFKSGYMQLFVANSVEISKALDSYKTKARQEELKKLEARQLALETDCDAYFLKKNFKDLEERVYAVDIQKIRDGYNLSAYGNPRFVQYSPTLEKYFGVTVANDLFYYTPGEIATLLNKARATKFEKNKKAEEIKAFQKRAAIKAPKPEAKKKKKVSYWP